jgi:hypothetical protein
VREIAEGPLAARALAFSPDGKLLAVAAGEHVTLHGTETSDAV